MSTIAAISTPLGQGGIGVIRVSGPDAISITQKCFFSKKPICDMKGYTAQLGHIKENDSVIDECVLTLFRAPRSFTGEDVCELSLHGGIFVLKKTLRLLFSFGAVPAEPGEFTKRAFLNGKKDLLKAEAVMDVISAQGERSLSLAENQLSGALSKKISKITDELSFLSAKLGAFVDYPDDEIGEIDPDDLLFGVQNAKDEIERLLLTFDTGRVLTKGAKVLILGKPNVGKSTLLNLFSGFERAIVTDVPGTTRDVLFETVVLDGVTVTFFDTAGIRDTTDEVEKIGVKKSIAQKNDADIILAVFDGFLPLSKEDEKIISLCKSKRAIAVINKSDKEQNIDEEHIRESFDSVISVSAKLGENADELKDAILKLLSVSDVAETNAVLTSERQFKALSDAKNTLVECENALISGVTLDAVDVLITDAIDSLLTLTGKKASERVIDEVFANFCVGK